MNTSGLFTIMTDITTMDFQSVFIVPAMSVTMSRENWFFHKSSWYMRGVNGYDGMGCNNTVCVPECKFYPSEGKLYHDSTRAKKIFCPARQLIHSIIT
jgi:hypothetical protein